MYVSVLKQKAQLQYHYRNDCTINNLWHRYPFCLDLCAFFIL